MKSEYKYLLYGAVALWLLRRETKKMADEISSDFASAHFKWDELIVSGGAPAIAKKYRERYPQGRWPKFLDPELWTNNRRYKPEDGQAIARRCLPKLINRPLSENMKEHLSNLVEPLREYLGFPLQIISGWRPPELNAAVGGAWASGHLLAIATDFSAGEEVKYKAKKWAQDNREKVGFFKIYDWGFHIGSPRGFNDHIISG